VSAVVFPPIQNRLALPIHWLIPHVRYNLSCTRQARAARYVWICFFHPPQRSLPPGPEKTVLRHDQTSYPIRGSSGMLRWPGRNDLGGGGGKRGRLESAGWISTAPAPRVQTENGHHSSPPAPPAPSPNAQMSRLVTRLCVFPWRRSRLPLFAVPSAAVSDSSRLGDAGAWMPGVGSPPWFRRHLRLCQAETTRLSIRVAG